jgi:hypothetical protein
LWPVGQPQGNDGREGGTLRFEQRARSTGWGYAGFVIFVLATIGVVIGWGFAFYLNQPPLSIGATLLLVPFSLLPVASLTGFLAAWCWAYTRPGWGRWLQGAVYRDNRWPRRGRPVDLAAAGRATVRGREVDGDYGLHLFLWLGAMKPLHIELAGSTCTRIGLAPAEKRLAIALADALADGGDRAGTRQAIADLRELAEASPGDIRRWIDARNRPAQAVER